jgi:hypothetical protein
LTPSPALTGLGNAGHISEEDKMEERRPIILSVHQTGTPQFPRWMVGDQFNRLWTGEGWADDEAKALRFASSNEACHEVQRLLLLNYTQLPHKRYRAPVYIDLFCDHDLSEIEIKRWLHRVAKLLIDSPTHGNGPVEGSLGLTTICWSELEEITGEGRA